MPKLRAGGNADSRFNIDLVSCLGDGSLVDRARIKINSAA
jgi:hypothetical protein